jgi:hypothetical protein
MSKAKQKGKHTPSVQKRSTHPVLVPGTSEITWIIEPRDPLIVRDGRPFGPNPSAQAISLDHYRRSPQQGRPQSGWHI